MCTARPQAGYQYMIDSLVLAVDKLHKTFGSMPVEFVAIDEQMWGQDPGARYKELQEIVKGRLTFQIAPPKPTPWRGKYRLTSRNYWAKNNAINTATCLATYDQLVFFDDHTLVNDDFLVSHWPIVTRNVAVAGGYRYYHQGIKVEGGRIVDGRPHEPGDYRLTKFAGIEPCGGSELFGGNVAYPLSALLAVNGASEGMDGAQGIEDQILGLLVSRVVKSMFNPFAIANQLTDEHVIIDGCSQGHPAAEIRGEPHVESEPHKTKLFPFRAADDVIHQYSFNHLMGWQLNAHKLGKHADGVNYTAVYDPALEGERMRIKAFGNNFNLKVLRNFIRSGKPFPVLFDKDMTDWRTLDGTRQKLSDM